MTRLSDYIGDCEHDQRDIVEAFCRCLICSACNAVVEACEGHRYIPLYELRDAFDERTA